MVHVLDVYSTFSYLKRSNDTGFIYPFFFVVTQTKWISISRQIEHDHITIFPFVLALTGSRFLRVSEANKVPISSHVWIINDIVQYSGG